MIQGYFIDGITNFAFFLTILLYRYINDFRGMDSFLIKVDRDGIKLFIKGCVIGFLMIFIYIIINIYFLRAKVSSNGTSLSMATYTLLMAAFSYFSVSIFEETFFRGYLMQKLLQRYSVVTSSVINSLIFGMLHYFRYSINTKFFFLGIMNVTLAGLLFSFVVVKTKSLMWAIGCHMLWDLTGALIFVEPCSFIHIELNKGLLCGSSAIPESGLIVTIFIISILAIIYQFRSNFLD